MLASYNVNAQKETTPHAGTPRFTSPYIALVDDDPSLGSAINLLLQAPLNGRFPIRHILSGRDAAHELAANPPEILILDLGLPDFDGLTVLRLLKRQPMFEDVPVLILTGNSSWQSAELALTAGADAHLLKPFAPLSLIGTVRELLRMREARRAARVNTTPRPDAGPELEGGQV